MPYPFRGRPLIGVVHLEALPGAPRARRTVDELLSLALRDAEAWVRGGADGLIVENFGDAPFAPDRVDPQVPAILAIVAREARARFRLPVGINVLRNDARSALAAALAAGASFVRVNVHTGAMETDQGIVQGRADETLRYRRALDAKVAIFADVFVKHAAPLFRATPGRAAADAVLRGQADALLVTGDATGDEADPARLAEVKRAAPRTPVLVASGITPGNVERYAAADGFVVGTWAKRNGRVDAKRVRELVAAIRRSTARLRRRGGRGRE
ncbi:MAG TPA: BtpA/SgcQ family protein [Planctomycetota bacterium]|nr:BtpA/SgcQ family protein [Planctomycetota bacterium]